jgi:MoaE-MoaD fusion protein
MVSIKILFFANLKELAGVRQLELVIPNQTTVLDLKNILQGEFPAIAVALQSSIIAVNHEFSRGEDLLHESDEIAIFPPVSGGGGDLPENDIYLITEDQLDLNELIEKITLRSTGAVCFFTGIVRGHTKRGQMHETSFLEYEAYVPMAEAKMRQVALEIREQWPAVERVAIVQRIGRLFPGTPTIAIACSAAHRDTGVFEAARFGIDRLKEIVPIWKKEVGLQGEAWIEGEYFPTPGE